MNSRKGISPLIAAVLLIAFTVSVSMIIMGWFSTFTRTTTANISASTTEAIGCNAASINIEHVYIGNSSTNTSSILVKNTGFTNLNVSGMVINTTGGTCGFAVTSLSKGAIISLTNSSCKIFPSGKSDWSRAIVTTNCGGVDDVTTDSSDVN